MTKPVPMTLLEMARAGGIARKAALTAVRRVEIAMMGVEARRQKAKENKAKEERSKKRTRAA